MDPNANLKEMRALYGKSIAGKRLTRAEQDRLCDLLECLDVWLSDGGFLPEDWKNQLASVPTIPAAAESSVSN